MQRFQIGESGNGTHLRKYATTTKDPTYEQCIDLFVREEQGHARLLAQLIKSLEGTVLTRHWSELAFVALRRMLGLKTEVFVLLIAEIIGKCFYKACADRLQNKTMKDVFSAIVMDEIFHLEFHCHATAGLLCMDSALLCGLSGFYSRSPTRPASSQCIAKSVFARLQQHFLSCRRPHTLSLNRLVS